ncbi:MAG TPA: glycosyltransferase family 2 protein [Puia sp.]|jgi:glycosyltransferase involved in cell wall biosynthesis
MSKIRSLGVLLCYNDADILEDAILHLLNTGHDLIAWDHGSDDDTAAVLDKYQGHLVERAFIPRSFDFYNLYQHMSEHLIKEYVSRYDWISWPDQDELLEGPDRTKSYQEWVAVVFEEGYDYVQFSNYNFWFTADDDPSILSPVQRVRHYGLFPDCAPRIRAWRASKTNIRVFNHNSVEGRKAPVFFNLRHYPMRTKEQMIRRLNKDRANLQRDGNNYHYNNMALEGEKLIIPADRLHVDDGVSELNPAVIYNWRDIYGYGPK